MTQEEKDEIQRKFDNVWQVVDELRRFRVRVLMGCLVGAFLVGLAYGEARWAIAGNADELKEREESIEKVPDLVKNQNKIAKGVNENGEVIRAIARKLEVELPDRPTVDVETNDDD